MYKLSIIGLFLILVVNVGFSQNQTNDEINDTTFTKVTLNNVNTSYMEVRPLIAHEGKILYFGRRYYPENAKGTRDFQDIYVAYKDSVSGTWGNIQNLGTLNNKKRNAVSSVSPDGKELILFNTYKKTKDSPIVKVQKTDKGWTEPKAVNIQNYVNVSRFADYYLDYKHNVLFLAIDGDISVGDQDIYISFPDGYGGWKEPVNLGPVINTEKADFAPFMGADGRSLFFCSYGHNTLGGSDIFMTVRLDNTWRNWSTPVNLGPAINTPNEETYFSIDNSFEYLYYTSYEKNSDERDIIRVNLPDDFNAINGPVLVKLDSAAISKIMLSGNYEVNPKGRRTNIDGVAFEGWPAEEEPTAVAIAEAQEATPQGDTTTESKQYASVDTGAKKSKEDEPTAGGKEKYFPSYLEGFVPADQATDLSPEAQEMLNYLRTRLPEVDLAVRQRGDSVEYKIVQNLLYGFNSIYVTPEYLPRLRNITRVLKEKPRLTIQLIGHTDSVGTEAANKEVAEQRVKNLVSYFKERMIESRRIEIVGAGHSEPVATNDTEEGRLQNRRVETIIRYMVGDRKGI